MLLQANNHATSKQIANQVGAIRESCSGLMTPSIGGIFAYRQKGFENLNLFFVVA